MPGLNLREDSQKTYINAVLQNIPTLTAAPFFSLKTEIVHASLLQFDHAGIFDLRKGIAGIKGSTMQHLFFAVETEPSMH